MADNGRKAGSFLLSALMTWSLVPHPVYALPAAGETTDPKDDPAAEAAGDTAAAQAGLVDAASQTPEAAQESNPAQQEAETVAAEDDGSDGAADEAAAEDVQAALGEKVDGPAASPDGADEAAAEDAPDGAADEPATQAGAVTVANVPYVDADGTLKQAATATLLSSVMTGTGTQCTLSSGWYLLDTDITQSKRILAHGDVHLILGDGHTLTANDGVYCPTNGDLTIYGQTAQTGRLDASLSSTTEGGAIGGTQGSGPCGDITVNGGVVNAKVPANKRGPGIGGSEGTGGSVTINGGTVTAVGGNSSSTDSAGIGTSSGALNSITINGGSVTATGNHGGPGIGNVGASSTSTIAITGGTVVARGSSNAAAIGTGNVDGTHVSISGGTVTATGGASAPAIGAGGAHNYGTIEISGGTVNATCGSGDNSSAPAAIGGASRDTGGTISITGGTVNASVQTNTQWGAAIGGGGSGKAGTITISGGARVTATACVEGIGTGSGGDNTGSITIDGAWVRVRSNNGPTEAGIGACGHTSTVSQGSQTPVTITGDAVVFADGPVATANEASWQGLVGQGRTASGGLDKDGVKTAKLYGATVKPAFDFEVPAGFTLTVEPAKTLRVENVAMNNLGTTNVEGTLDYTGGRIYNSGTLTEVDQGRIIPRDAFSTPVAPATVAVAGQGTAPTYGDTVSLSATVTSANGSTGTVTFYVNGTAVGTATPDGSGVATLADVSVTDPWHGGSNSVYAVFSGGTDQADATSPTVTYAVDRKDLADPAGLAWTTPGTGGVVTWNAVDHARYYTVQLVKDGAAQGLPLYAYNPDGAPTLQWTFPITDPGSYTATVTAVGDINYANSQASTTRALNTVSFAGNGPSGAAVTGVPAMQLVLAGATATEPGAPTAAGYVFTHWTAPDGTDPFAPAAAVADPTTYTANWGLTPMAHVRWGASGQAAWDAVPNAADYLVTLYRQSGGTATAVGTAHSVLPPATDLDMTAMTAPGTYSFSVQALGSTGVASNAATSSPLASSVSFDLAGATSSAIPARFVTHGQAVGAVAAPTRAGATFTGWTGGSLSTPTADVSSQTVSGPVTYTAHWKLSKVQNPAWGDVAADGTSATATWTPSGAGVSGYSVQLYKNGVVEGSPVTVSGGGSSSASVAITPEEGASYTFTVTPEGADADAADAADQSAALDTVTFVPENGGTATHQLVKAGQSATAPAAPTWSAGSVSNAFRFWNVAPAAGAAAPTAGYDFSAAVNAPLTLHGYWTLAQTQNVRFDGVNRVAWDAVPGAEDYAVKITSVGGGSRDDWDQNLPPFTVPATATSVDLDPKGVTNGTFRIRVTPEAPNNPYVAEGRGGLTAGTARLLRYNLAGGTLPAGASAAALVPTGQAFPGLPTPTRTGFTFEGWFSGNTQFTDKTVIADGDGVDTVTARWKLAAAPAHLAWDLADDTAPGLTWTAPAEAAGYTVTLSRNGSAVSGTPVVNGTSATFPAAMVSLPGTYTATVAATATDASASDAASSTDLYTVDFAAGTAGSGAASMPAMRFAEAAGTVAEPADPTSPDYVFAGWADASGTDPFAGGASLTVGTSPVTLTAQWDLKAPANPSWGAGNTSAVFGAVAHATGYEVTLAGPGAQTTVFRAPAASGATVTVDLSGAMGDAGTYTYSVKALGTASGSAEAGDSAPVSPAKAVHTVTFDAAGGSRQPMDHVLDGTAATDLPTPARTGYTFAGWDLPDGTRYTDQAVGDPTTLTAAWTVNSYTVTFDANGGDPVAAATFPYDRGLANLPVPTRAGAEFLGWYDASGNRVTSVPANSQDTALTARWQVEAPVWDASAPGTATWAAVAGASSYTATLMRQEDDGGWSAVAGQTRTGLTATSEDFHDAVVAAGPGTYAVTVAATGSDGAGDASTSAVSNRLFTVSVDENHGSVGTASVRQLVVDGSTVNVSALSTPTWASNAFRGWTLQLADKALGTAYDGTAAVDAPVTLYAQWQLAAPSFGAAVDAWSVSSSDPTAAEVAWGAVTGATGYTVQLEADGASSGAAQTPAAGTTSASFSGLDGADATYTASVTATGGLGVLSSDAVESPALYSVAWDAGTADAVAGLPASPRLAPAGTAVTRPAADPSRTGYDFSGWKAGGADALAPGAAYTVNGPTTFTAAWGLKAVDGVEWANDNTAAAFDPVTGADSYTVHVTGTDGGSTGDVTVAAADATAVNGKVVVDLSGTMKTAGTYTFSVEAAPAAGSGLAVAPATAVGSSVSSVSFALAGATSAAIPMRFVAHGSEVGTVGAPARDGAAFAGWTGPGLAAATADISAQTVSAPVTYTATWQMNQPENLRWAVASADGATAAWDAVDGATSYTVSLVHDGRDVAGSAVTVAGTGSAAPATQAAFTIPADETGSWSFKVSAAGDSAADSAQASSANQTPAQQRGMLYSVTFDGNGGTTPARQLVVSGGTAPRPADPSRTGYTFGHWALASAPATPYDFSSPVTGPVELTARWTQDTYVVTYHLNGGTNPAGAPTGYTFDDGVTLPTPTRTGYTFGGWYDNDRLTGSPVSSIAAGTSTGNKAYWAKWDANAYTVAFDPNAPAGFAGAVTAPAAQTFDYDKGLKSLPPATSGDFDFTGWNTAADGSGTAVSSIAASTQAGDLTLYAQWQLKQPAAPAASGEDAVGWAAVPGATGYEVRVLDGTGAVVPDTEVAVTVGGTSASLAPTAAASGKSYTVQVRATGAAGAADSAWSAASGQLHAVTFDPAGGTLARPAGAVVLVGDGRDVASNGDPAWTDGDKFVGWFAPGASAQTTFPAAVGAPVTYTAHWQKAAPAQPVWTGTTQSHTTAQWDAVDRASTYTVQLMKRDANGAFQPVGSPVSVAAGTGSILSHDFSSQISGDGTWAFTVVADGDGAAPSDAARAAALYSVAYDADGGTLDANVGAGTDALRRVYATDGQVLTLPVPRRDGCEFTGWRVSSASGADAGTGTYTVTGETVLVAAWNVSAPTGLAWSTADPGTAVFKTVPGATGYSVQPMKQDAGGAFRPVGNPVPATVAADGASASADLAPVVKAEGAGTYAFSVTATGASGTGTATARLPKDAASLVTVSYDANAASGQTVTGVPAMQLCVAGDTAVTEPANPVFSSNTFEGWRLSAGDATAWDGFGTAVDAPVELHATWKLAPVDAGTMVWDLADPAAPSVSFDAVAGADGYTVTLDRLASGAATATSQTVDASRLTEANGKVTVDLSGLMDGAGTYTLSAAPTSTRAGYTAGDAVQAKKVYTVSFLASADVTGTLPAMELVVDGGHATDPAASLKRPGATFREWRTAGATSAYDFAATAVTVPVELHATFGLDAPTGLTWTVAGGSAAGDEAHPNWGNVAGATSYTVTLYQRGTAAPVATVDEADGTATLALPIPSGEGAFFYTVTATSDDPTLLPSAASAASPDLYTVTFAGNGASTPVPPRQLVVDGEAAAAPVGAPKRDGAVFDHWTAAADPVTGAAFSFAGSAAPDKVGAPTTLTACWTMDAPARGTLAWNAAANGDATVAAWGAVDGNDGYTVTLTEPDGTTVEHTVAKGTSSIDLGPAGTNDIAGAGTWTFAVRTLGDNAAASAPATGPRLVSAHFDVNGGSLITTPALNGRAYVYVQQGGTVAEPAHGPTSDGYTFTGWQVGGRPAAFPYTVGDAPVDFAAQWRANTYTISYEADGGTVAAGAPAAYTFGQAAALPGAGDVSRTGYDFAGWYDNAQLSGSPVTEVAAGQLGNKTYWAKWVEHTYRVTLDVNAPAGATASLDGADVTEYTFGTGAALPGASAPGYRFVGWYDGSGTKVDAITATDTGDKDLAAHWQLAAPTGLAWSASSANAAVATWTGATADATYTVALQRVGADGSRTTVASHSGVTGSSYDFSADIRGLADGGAGSYAFTVSATPTVASADGAPVAASDTASLDTATSPRLVTVAYDAEGGSEVPLGLVVAGHALGAAPVSTKAGSRLDGWYAAGSDAPFDFAGTVVSAPSELSARWTLHAPADPAWSAADAKTATWKPVAGASGYRVQLYRDGVADGSPTVLADGSASSAALPVDGAGSFTFTVTALGTGATADSAPTAQSAGLYSVTFDGNGPAVTGVPGTAYVRAGGTVAEPQDVANGTSALAGWYTAAGQHYDFADAVTAPVALTARWALAEPAAPVWDLTGATTDASQRLSWKAVDNAASYEVTLSGGASPVTKTVPAGTTDCTFDITAPGTYTATVRALGASGYTAADSTASTALVTLAFEPDGGSPAPAMEVVAAGTAPVRPADPARTDYTFDGWYEGGAAAKAAGDPAFDFAKGLDAPATVTAVWQLVAPKGAQWNPGVPGQALWAPVASATGYTVDLYRDNAKVDTYSATAQEHSHTFSITQPGTYRYYVTATGTGLASPVVTSDDLYTVSFAPNGGTATPAMQLVVAGNRATVPAKVERPGSTFQHWSADGASGAAYDFSNTGVSAPVTLTAVWRLDAPADPVWTAAADGGTASWKAVAGATGYDMTVRDASGAEAASYKNVSGTSQAVALDKDGAYTFEVTALGGGAADPVADSAAAQSAASATGGTLYSVTYDADGGTLASGAGSLRTFVASGQRVEAPQGAPTRPGYVFEGWRDGDAAGPAYLFGQTTDRPVALVAAWSPDAPASAQWSDGDAAVATWSAVPGATYTVRLLNAAGEQVASEDVAAGTTSFDFAPAMARAGAGTYSFEVVANAGGASSDAARSEAVQTVTFDGNGASVSDVPAMAFVKDGGTLAKPQADPSQGGSTFVAWADGSASGAPYDFSDAVDAPVALFATWRLDAPAGLAWKAAPAGDVAWDTVPGATGYTVRLLDGSGAPVGGAQTVSDARAALPVSAPGTYSFEVVANGPAGYTASDAASSVTAHTVTFAAGAPSGVTGVPAMEMVADGAKVGPVAAPTRDGYLFDGWRDAAGAAFDPAADTVGAPTDLTAAWKLERPTNLGWDLADGASTATWSPVTGAASYVVSVYDAATHRLVRTIDTSVAADPAATSADLALPAGSYVYTVQAQAPGLTSSEVASVPVAVHSVTYDYNDGTAAPAAVRFVENGHDAPELSAPDRTAEGWAFDGWRQGTAAGAAWDFSRDTVGAPVDLVAAWRGIEYKVTLDTDGGTVNAGDVTSYTHGTAQPLPGDVTHVGCTFGGWYTDADFHDPDFHNPGFSGTPVTEVPAGSVGDVTYHAKWIPITYRVTLDPEGGTVLDRYDTHYTYGSGLSLPQHVVRDGYTFEGWFTDPDGGVEVADISDTHAGDVHLFAHWRANDYRLTLEANGGTLPADAPDGYVHGKACPLPADVAREGYTFEGWYADPDFSGSPVAEVGADAIGDKTFYARWLSQAVEPSSVTVAGTSGTLGDGDVFVVLPFGTPSLPTDPAELAVALPAGATMTTPVTTDGGRTWRFTVTAEDGRVTEDYTVHVSIAPDPQAQEKADLAAAVSTVQAQPTAFWTVPQAQAPTQDATRLWLSGKLARLPLNGSLYEVRLDSWRPATAGTADDPDGTDGSFTFTVVLRKASQAGGPLEAQTFVIRGVITATPFRAAGGQGMPSRADLEGGVRDALARETGRPVPAGTGAVAATGDPATGGPWAWVTAAAASVAATLWALVGRRRTDDGPEA